MDPIKLSEFLSLKIKEPESIVGGGWVLRDNLTFVIGPAKLGKSVFIANLALALTVPSPFLGLFGVPRARRVLYIQQEVATAEVQKRLRLMTKALPTNLELYLWSERGLRLDTQSILERMRENIAAVNPDVIILDPLRRFHGIDENSSQQVGRFVELLETFAEGRSIIIVHHTGKPNPEYQQEGGYAGRGSSVWFDSGATYLNLQPLLNDWTHQITFSKRYGEPLPKMTIERDSSLLYHVTHINTGESVVGKVLVTMLHTPQMVESMYSPEQIREATEWVKRIQ